MKHSLVLFIIFIFPIKLLMAQPGPGTPQGDILKTLLEEGPGDRVRLEVDPLLLANYNKLIARNMLSAGIPGYRIRIYSGSGLGAKEEQQTIRARFLSLYPGLDAYNRYDEPFFKIYVGDCRTKSDALKLKDDIEKNFPNSIIRPDFINIKSEE
jgi:hypothetical protein